MPESGETIEAVVSYPELGSYRTDPYFLGATVGPFANRIRGGEFTLDGNRYRLDINEAGLGNCLHGGAKGLHRQLFSLKRDEQKPKITCRTDVADGFDGFPGDRTFEVVYELLDDWSLAIDFNATTDKDTIVSLANHADFNLGGPIDEHWIRVCSDSYTPIDRSMIPTGELRDVGANTP